MKPYSLLLACAMIVFGCSNQESIGPNLPRGNSSKALDTAFEQYLQICDQTTADTSLHVNVHSIMIVQHGKVIKEHWREGASADAPHILNSVSKTFTSTAVGILIDEGKLKLDDQVIKFFPNELPDEISDNLRKMTVRDLLTMTCGHDVEPGGFRGSDDTWVKTFLKHPVVHTPGTFYCYNSYGTYMLSAIVQTITGQDLVEYLMPRLFEPLNIDRPEWGKSPQGICFGGFGLNVKTEDLAKVGQLYLQNGVWNGKQIISAQWCAEASKKQVNSLPAGQRPETVAANGYTVENSDWMQGYGYQMWRSRYNGYRADGANGQYILVFPDKDLVIAMTAHSPNMQTQLDQVFETLLPVL